MVRHGIAEITDPKVGYLFSMNTDDPTSCAEVTIQAFSTTSCGLPAISTHYILCRLAVRQPTQEQRLPFQHPEIALEVVQRPPRALRDGPMQPLLRFANPALKRHATSTTFAVAKPALKARIARSTFPREA